MVKDVYDQNIPTVAFWSLATSPGHVGIQRGKLMWHKIQPGPIRCLYGPSPLIQPIYVFSYEFFVSFMDQAQHCSLFIFGPWPSLQPFYFWPMAFLSQQFHFFHLRPFCDKNRWSKAVGRKLKLATFFVICKRSLVPRPNFWSLAASPGHVGIRRGNLMWRKNQPDPIRCLYGPSPLIQPIYIFFLCALIG